MAKPVILSVDDDPEVLNAVERDLRQHFRADYRIIKASSGPQALEAVRQLKQRGTTIALFLVDERMPDMSGTEFLREAKKLYPETRRVLLTAYADIKAAIMSINEVALHHYLLKPWHPPDEKLFPVLDDQLEKWSAQAPPLYEGIKVLGTELSAPCYGIKEFLSRHHVPYAWIDLDTDPTWRELARSMDPDLSRLPIVLLNDGSAFVHPTERELAERLGMHTKAEQEYYDLIVIGAGPAGLAASVYGASEGLRTLLVECTAPGGQAGTSSLIENYLGFPAGLSGDELARRAEAQAHKFGAELLTTTEATRIVREDPYRVVHLADGTSVSCKALVVATGMEVRRLNVPGIDEFSGVGVYYGAALTEAATYRGKDVYIVGGANSAGQGAVFFSRYARTVTMLIRGPSISAGMSQYLINRITETHNIQIEPNTRVVAVSGNRRLESITIANSETGEVRDVPASALFIFIGTAPRTQIVADLVTRDAHGFIVTGRDLMVDGRRPRDWNLPRDPFLFETDVPGIFAAGDARAGSGKRVASAVGEGSATVSVVHEYLSTV